MLGMRHVALLDALARGAGATGTSVAATSPHFVPRAKRVIFIFLDGGL